MRPVNSTKILDEMREYILLSHEWDASDVDYFTQLFERLDNWMTGGGPLPEQWQILRGGSKSE
jgi:hypothetical protein